MKLKHLIYGMSIFALACGMAVSMAGCEDDGPSSATDFKLEYPKKIETTDTLVIVSASQAVITAIPQPAGSSLNAKSIEWISSDETIVTVNQFGIVVGVGDFERDTTTLITVKANGATKLVPVKLLPLPLPARKGSWLFDEPANPFKATIGKDLEPSKDRWPNFERGTADISGHKAVDGPTFTNGALRVSRNYSLFADHGLSPNGDGVDDAKRVNEYTVFFWLKHEGNPENGGWKPFMKIRRPLQDPAVSDKGGNGNDFGLRSGARSWGWDDWVRDPISGKMDNFDPKVWNRIVVTVKNGPDGFIKIYWDGNLIAEKGYNRPDYDRVSLDPEGLVFFTRGSDGNPSINDEDDVQVAELAIWDVAFNDALVSKLEASLNK